MLVLRAVMNSGAVIDKEVDGMYDCDEYKNAAMYRFLTELIDNKDLSDGDFIEEIMWLSY